MIERATLLTDATVITAGALGLEPLRGAVSEPRQATSRPALEGLMRDVERAHLVEALEASAGNITRAAARLGVPRNTLRYRLDKHGLGPDADPARRRGGRPPVHSGVRTERPAPPTPTSDVQWEPRRLTWLRVVLNAHQTGPLSSDVTRTLEAIVDKAQSFGGQIHEIRPSGVAIAFGLDAAEDAARRCVHAAVGFRRARGSRAEGTSRIARPEPRPAHGPGDGWSLGGRTGHRTGRRAISARRARCVAAEGSAWSDPRHSQRS